MSPIDYLHKVWVAAYEALPEASLSLDGRRAAALSAWDTGKTPETWALYEAIKAECEADPYLRIEREIWERWDAAKRAAEEGAK